MIGLPSSSYWTYSNSACAMPWAMPPCCWPATSIGLRMRPQSSTATWRSSVDAAGLEVDLDDGDVGAERERRVALGEVQLVREAALVQAVGPAGWRRWPPSPARPTTAPWRGRRHTCRPSSPLDDVVLVRLEQVGGELLGPCSSTSLDGDVHGAARRSAASASPSCPRPGGPRPCRTGRGGPCPSGRRAGRRRSSRRRCRGPGRGRDVPTLTTTVPSSSTETEPYSVEQPERRGDLDVGRDADAELLGVAGGPAALACSARRSA